MSETPGYSLLAACLEVMATLLVVGVMDDARADIQGNGQVQLTAAERVSQVRPSLTSLYVAVSIST